MRRIACLIITISIVLTSLLNTYATPELNTYAISGLNTHANSDDKTVLELTVDSATAKIDGKVSKTEKPFKYNGTTFIPLEWFTTAIGAEVIKDGKRVQIIYCDSDINLTTGANTYTANVESKKLKASPVVKNGFTMVPLEFLAENFPVTVTMDKKGSIKIILEDDGALKDLSFLTGGITTAKVGNSFYGYSITVPSGSRIISNSFNSRYLSLSNEAKQIYIEIKIKSKNDKTLDELYNDVLYSSAKRESKIEKNAKYPYFQYTSLSEFDEATLTRVYQKGDSFYYLMFYSYDASVSPEKLVSDKTYYNIVNSFSLDYKSGEKNVTDFSKVSNGEAQYLNYISLSDESKYLPWGAEVPANWDTLALTSSPTTTYIGTDSKHYLKVTINSLPKEGVDKYVDGIKLHYQNTFSPKLYSFTNDEEVTLGNIYARNLKFSIIQGGIKYKMEEFYYQNGEFLYEVTIKLPEKEYEKSISEFKSAVKKMQYYDIDNKKYSTDLEGYTSKNSRIQISDKEEAVDYISKNYKWSIKLPGYFTKDPTDFEGNQTFVNPKNDIFINISVLENSSLSKTLTDEERFSIIQLLNSKYEMKLLTSTKQNMNGFDVRAYTYSIQNADYDMYSNVTCYCLENDKFTYCFLAIQPELTTTESSTKQVQDIWNTFRVN